LSTIAVSFPIDSHPRAPERELCNEMGRMIEAGRSPEMSFDTSPPARRSEDPSAPVLSSKPPTPLDDLYLAKNPDPDMDLATGVIAAKRAFPAVWLS